MSVRSLTRVRTGETVPIQKAPTSVTAQEQALKVSRREWSLYTKGNVSLFFKLAMVTHKLYISDWITGRISS